MKNLKKLALTGIAAASLAGCFDDATKYSQRTRESFNEERVPVQEFDYSGLPFEEYIIDKDNDGKADLITYSARAIWVADKYSCNNADQYLCCEFVGCDNAKVMTPEIREAATRVMNESRELSYLLNEENLRLQKLKGSKE